MQILQALDTHTMEKVCQPLFSLILLLIKLLQSELEMHYAMFQFLKLLLKTNCWKSRTFQHGLRLSQSFKW